MVFIFDGLILFILMKIIIYDFFFFVLCLYINYIYFLSLVLILRYFGGWFLILNFYVFVILFNLLWYIIMLKYNY